MSELRSLLYYVDNLLEEEHLKRHNLSEAECQKLDLKLMTTLFDIRMRVIKIMNDN